MADFISLALVAFGGLCAGIGFGLFVGAYASLRIVHEKNERGRTEAARAINRIRELEQEYKHEPMSLIGSCDAVLCGLLLALGRVDVVDEYERILRENL